MFVDMLKNRRDGCSSYQTGTIGNISRLFSYFVFLNTIIECSSHLYISRSFQGMSASLSTCAFVQSLLRNCLEFYLTSTIFYNYKTTDIQTPFKSAVTIKKLKYFLCCFDNVNYWQNYNVSMLLRFHRYVHHE